LTIGTVETPEPDGTEASIIDVARTASRGLISFNVIRAANVEELEFSIASETTAPSLFNENFVADSFTRRLGLFAEYLAANIEAEKRHTNTEPIKRWRITTTSCFPVVRLSQHQPEAAEAMGRAAARLTMSVCDQWRPARE
jgi:hypothetical protein